MKNYWEKFKNLRIWATLGAVFRKVGAFFAAVGRGIATGAKAFGRAFCVFGRWLLEHWRAATAVAALVLVAVGIFLGLFLTLPVKSVEVEGEVILLEGEAYTGGFNIKATTKAGLVHREEVSPKMLSGLDPSTPGEQTVTVAYGKWRVSAKINVVALSDIALYVREGTLPLEYEPNDPFPTRGVFDLYYNGEIIRSAPITKSQAPGFTTRLCGDYNILLTYQGIIVEYSYTVIQRVVSFQPMGILLAEQGAPLDKNNVFGAINFLATFNDGRTEIVPFHDENVLITTAELPEAAGMYDAEITLLYYGVPFVCSVETYPKGAQHVLSSLSLRAERLVYKVGETPDLSAFTVLVDYAFFSGTIELPLSADMVRGGVGPFEEAVAAVDFTIDYMGSSASVTLRVVTEEVAGTVTDLSTIWKGARNGVPSRGEELDYENAQFSAIYGYGYRVERLPITAELVSGYDIAASGPQTLVLAYGGCSIEIDILVKDPDLADVATEILSLDKWNDLTFFSSESLVLPGDAALYVSYGYGYRFGWVSLSDPAVTNDYVPGQLGAQIVTFTYAGLNIQQSVVVRDNRIEGLTGISIPTWVKLDPADEFDLSRITITLNYSEGYITEYMSLKRAVEEFGAEYTFASDFYPEIPNTYYMRVALFGFTTNNCAVIISGPVASGISLETDAPTVEYRVGDVMDPSVMHLYMNYADGSREELTFSQGMVEGFDTSSVGVYNKRVIYIMTDRSRRRFECAFNYVVVE